MSIIIDREKCTGCGRCHEVCPGTLIKIDSQRKAYIKYPYNCWGCTSCMKECKAYAIRFYLGADMGGRGSLMHTEKKGDITEWIIDLSDGSQTVIKVNSKESNKY